MTKQERIATHFQVPVETIRYEQGIGWWYHDRQNKRQILLGKSFYEVQSTPDWALGTIT